MMKDPFNTEKPNEPSKEGRAAIEPMAKLRDEDERPRKRPCGLRTI